MYAYFLFLFIFFLANWFDPHRVQLKQSKIYKYLLRILRQRNVHPIYIFYYRDEYVHCNNWLINNIISDLCCTVYMCVLHDYGIVVVRCILILLYEYYQRYFRVENWHIRAGIWYIRCNIITPQIRKQYVPIHRCIYVYTFKKNMMHFVACRHGITTPKKIIIIWFLSESIFSRCLMNGIFELMKRLSFIETMLHLNERFLLCWLCSDFLLSAL